MSVTCDEIAQYLNDYLRRVEKFKEIPDYNPSKGYDDDKGA
jgi:hypothetical protein